MTHAVELPSKAAEMAAFAVSLRWEDIPPTVRERAKCHVLDTVGLSIVGMAETSLPEIAAALVASDGNRECVVIGTPYRLGATNAALVNGMSAHVFDCDDTHLGSTTHPSGVIVPVALAMGERTGADGRTLLAAVVGGYEIIARFGYALPEVSPFKRGFQVTTLYGVFAAAVTAGKIMGLTASQLTHAIGVAASQACGLRQFSAAHEVSEVKRFHSGWPALAGIMAAQLAQAGLTAPRQAIEGDMGLYATLLGARPSDPDALTRGFGETWETMGLVVKAHACVQGAQPFVDAAAALHAAGVSAAGIDGIELALGEFGANHLCEPAQDKRHPANAHMAALALPFCVALAFARGGVRPADLTEATIHDAEILALADKVTHRIATAAELQSDTGAPLKGWIILRRSDGTTLCKAVTSYRGALDNPMSPAEYQAKFHANAASFSEDRRDALVDGIMAIETGDLSRLYTALSGADAKPPAC